MPGHHDLGPPSPRSVRRRVWVGAAALTGAIAAFAANSLLGELFTGPHDKVSKEIAVVGTTVAFVVLSAIALRELAVKLAAVVRSQAGKGAGGAVRLVTQAAGYVIVLFIVLGMLSVSAGKLLVGGAITGVVIGIAAQQVLGNIFAGIVLLVVRPFVVGDRIRIRSGSLGGVFEGVVQSVGLTYVALKMEDGLVNIPNSGMLAAGVGRLLPSSHPSHAAVGTAGTAGTVGTAPPDHEHGLRDSDPPALSAPPDPPDPPDMSGPPERSAAGPPESPEPREPAPRLRRSPDRRGAVR